MSEPDPEKIRGMSTGQFVAGFADYCRSQEQRLAEEFDKHFFGEHEYKSPDGSEIRSHDGHGEIDSTRTEHTLAFLSQPDDSREGFMRLLEMPMPHWRPRPHVVMRPEDL